MDKSDTWTQKPETTESRRTQRSSCIDFVVSKFLRCVFLREKIHCSLVFIDKCLHQSKVYSTKLPLIEIDSLAFKRLSLWGLQFLGSCFHRNLLRRKSDIITTWVILIRFLAICIPGTRVHVIILQNIICFQHYYGALFRLFFLQSHGGIKTAFFSFGSLRNLDDKFV